VVLPDTLGYSFNFERDKGSIIFAADSRVSNSILAFVGSGTFELSNPGFLIFLEQAENRLVEEIAEAQQKRDSLAVVISEKLYKIQATNSTFDTNRSSSILFF